MSDLRSITIDGRAVGPGHPAWIIAEIGVNHDGDVEKARALIRLAAECGADAVKLQMFEATQLASAGAPLSQYQRGNVDAVDDQLEMLHRLQLPWDGFASLRDEASEVGVTLFASPFDETSLTRLVDAGSPAVKLGSGELTNEPLLRRAARSGIPLILSTGMADWDEVDLALSWARAEGACPIVMHCVTAYPTPLAEANVAAVATLDARYDCIVGYSDHTLGSVASLAARALGACVIERHLTHDTAAPGPDHATSLDGAAFAQWVREIRDLEAALGDGEKRHRGIEAEGRRNARKSIVAVRDIEVGTVIEADMLATRRPGTGIPPRRLRDVVGRRARRRIERGCALSESDIDGVERAKEPKEEVTA